MTRRITVEEVLEAYRVTGMKPCEMYYVMGDMACAVGVMAIAAGVEKRASVACQWGDEHLDSSYHGGFTTGFDGRKIHESASESMKLGYADGTAVREAVFAKGAT